MKKMQNFSSKSSSPPFLWSLGLVLLRSVPPVSRRAWPVTGLDGDCLQRGWRRSSPAALAPGFWELLWGKEVLGIYDGFVLCVAIH